MIPAACKDRLVALLGPRGYLDRPEDLSLYEYDGGVDKHRPDLVVFPRTTGEVSAIVLVTQFVSRRTDGWWSTVLISVVTMLVVSFVVIGVGPRTLGRQHATPVALWSAGPLKAVTRILGPLPRLLILVGNALTPGRGFSEGPFSTETELRELVDMAEASAVIESGERKMIHSVFELGDTTVREVMVPRNDVVFIERHKNLRQTMSLFLPSGFSRVPVIGENLDDVVGFAYLKDVTRRIFENADAETTEMLGPKPSFSTTGR